MFTKLFLNDFESKADQPAVMNVIVEIDGFYGNSLVVGKTCSITELRHKVDVTQSHCTSMVDFTDVFCRLFHFERLPSMYKEGVRSDYVIDIDTDRIYMPRY